MSRNNAQVSVEVIILLTVGVIFLILFLKLYSDKNLEVEYSADVLAARQVVNSIAMGINNIASAKNGTNQTVYVQTKIEERNYNLTVRDNTLDISWYGGYYDYPLVTSNVSFTQGGSKYQIIKNGEQVVIQ